MSKLIFMVVSTTVGSVLEFFEFTIFILFSPYIANAFFPNFDPKTGLMPVLLLYATGYLARPLGGIMFGHYGDRYGRKQLFLISITLMFSATICIGLLPNYEQIGVTAVCLLTVFRILQGISLGGEMPGSTVFLAEHVPARKRGFAVSLVIAGASLGGLLSSLFGLVLTSLLSSESMYDWGWRIPFLFGGLLGVVGLIIRRNLTETPVFEAIRKSKSIHQLPIVALIKKAWRQILVGVGLTSMNGAIFTVKAYIPSHIKTMGTFDINPFKMNVVTYIVGSSLIVIYGWLSDKIGRRNQLILTAVLIIPAIFVCYIYMENNNNNLGLWMMVLTIIAIGSMATGAFQGAIIELYPTHIRYSGVGLSLSVGVVLFVGLAPLVINRLSSVVGLNLTFLLFFIPIACLLLISAAQIPKDVHLRPLNELDWKQV